jgi:hypothetical protein
MQVASRHAPDAALHLIRKVTVHEGLRESIFKSPSISRPVLPPIDRLCIPSNPQTNDSDHRSRTLLRNRR